MATAFFEESLQIFRRDDQRSLGSFYLSVQELETQKNNYNVKLSSRGMIDGIDSSTIVSAVVRKQDFATVSVQQLETIQTAQHAMKIEIEFGWEYENGREKSAFLKRSTPKQTTRHIYTKEHFGYFISEAACFLILRLLSLGEIDWDFFGGKFSTLDKYGEVCRLEFYSIAAIATKTNDCINISKRVINMNGCVDTWLYQYRPDGKLIQWRHKDTPIVFRAITMDSQSNYQQNAAYKTTSSTPINDTTMEDRLGNDETDIKLNYDNAIGSNITSSYIFSPPPEKDNLRLSNSLLDEGNIASNGVTTSCAESTKSIDSANESLHISHKTLANKSSHKISFNDDVLITSFDSDAILIKSTHQQSDSRILDNYHDIKSNVRERCTEYLNEHPEIRHLFAELLRETMRSRPPNWIQFAAEFFKSRITKN